MTEEIRPESNETESTEVTETSEQKPGPFRRLYNWMLDWADHPFGNVALFLLAVAESSFFPIPPDPLLMAMGIGRPNKAFRLALLCTLGSVIGGIIGYGIGFWTWEASQEWFFSYVFSQDKFDGVQKLYNDWQFWLVLGGAFTPIPYKIITISCGIAKSNFMLFILVSVIGRGSRFFLVSFFIRKFGDKARDFIDKHFNLLALAFFVLLLGGFFVLKKLLH